MTEEFDTLSRSFIEARIEAVQALQESLRVGTRIYTALVGVGFLILLLVIAFLGWLQADLIRPGLFTIIQSSSVGVDATANSTWPASALVWSGAIAFMVVAIAGAGLLASGYIALGRMVRDE